MDKPAIGAPIFRGKRSQLGVLIGLQSQLALWHDRAGLPYATVLSAVEGLHLEVHGAPFRQWLARTYFEQCGGAPNSGAISDAVAFFAAKGTFAKECREVFLRVGREGGALLWDTCLDGGAVIRMSVFGATIDDRCPTPFRRPPGIGCVPRPVPGGTIGELREFINVAPDDWPLIGAWLLAALRPEGPYPVLFLHGEQGAGKSTQARVLRSLIDPNFAPLRAAPKDEQDLAVAAHHNWVIALDNLSHLPAWLSDALCRVATGGGYATRALYANDRETVFNFQRPVIVTGIEDLAVRSDLLDRSIVVYLPIIADTRRRAEREFWYAFEEARPRIVGALANAAVEGLRAIAGVSLTSMPRLADFAVWGVACSAALGCVAGEFEALYKRSIAEHSVAAVEASALARPLVGLALGGYWRGTTADLLYAVEALAGRYGIRRAGWPRSLPQFAACIRRLAPNLRMVGVEVTFERAPGSGRRLICLDISDAALARAAGTPAPPPPAVQPGLFNPIP